MNRMILNKALKTLKDRKTSAERIADANYKVALENKDFENIDKLMRSLTIEISKKSFGEKIQKMKPNNSKNSKNKDKKYSKKTLEKIFQSLHTTHAQNATTQVLTEMSLAHVSKK